MGARIKSVLSNSCAGICIFFHGLQNSQSDGWQPVPRSTGLRLVKRASPGRILKHSLVIALKLNNLYRLLASISCLWRVWFHSIGSAVMSIRANTTGRQCSLDAGLWISVFHCPFHSLHMEKFVKETQLSNFNAHLSKDCKNGPLNVMLCGRQWGSQTERILFAGRGNLAKMTLLNFGLARARLPADCWKIEVVGENTSVCFSVCLSLFGQNITQFGLELDFELLSHYAFYKWLCNKGFIVVVCITSKSEIMIYLLFACFLFFFNNSSTNEWANSGITVNMDENNGNKWKQWEWLDLWAWTCAGSPIYVCKVNQH